VEITEIRIKLMNDPNDRLQAFCSITFDSCFVIRDLKIIQGTRGSFVAMPSRKLTDRCPRCSAKNHLRSRFCSECGTRLHEDRADRGDDGRARLYADIAHPINSECREMIQQRVIVAFGEEVERSRLPGYICTYDDYGEDNYARLGEEIDEMGGEPMILSVGDAIRRRDAAAAQQAPHHLTAAMAEGDSRRVYANGTATGVDEDNFGVGLV
jgi:stage V sporulation protein G